MNSGQLKEVVCLDVAFTGKGVAMTDEGVVFVKGLFPGEKGEIRILYRRNGSWFGRLMKLTKLSPDRLALPLCQIFSACGGCQFQPLAYPAQLKIKTNLVRNAFKRYFQEPPKVLDILGMKEPTHYRRKIQMPFGLDKKQRPILGYYREDSHDVIPVRSCVIEDLQAEPIRRAVLDLVRKYDLKVYDEKSDTGLLRHLLIRTASPGGGVMVVLVTKSEHFPAREAFVHDLLGRCQMITTVVQNVNGRKTNVILGPKDIVLFGLGRIRERLLSTTFSISPQSFFQVNPKQAEVVYKTALSFAGLTKEDEVFDACSGIGVIALLAAPFVRHVLGVEIVPSAVHDAQRNAKLNGIENVTFLLGDAGKVLDEQLALKKHFDVIFLDPPRKGLTTELITALKGSKAERIVYVSCEPETLARDTALLKDEYVISRIQPVDMFPYTRHVECVVLLTRIEQKTPQKP